MLPWGDFPGMNNFDAALEIVLLKEGGWVNDPEDNGGETNLGISTRAHPGVDIKNITPEIAREIYLRDYWTPAGCEGMNWPICLLVFDFAVNSGVSRAVRTLQRRLGVRQDGVVGPITLRAANRATRSTMLRYLVDRARFMEGLADWPHFANGWLMRLMSLASLLGK
jgi:lysozyme family protein